MTAPDPAGTPAPTCRCPAIKVSDAPTRWRHWDSNCPVHKDDPAMTAPDPADTSRDDLALMNDRDDLAAILFTVFRGEDTFSRLPDAADAILAAGWTPPVPKPAGGVIPTAPEFHWHDCGPLYGDKPHWHQG